MANWINPAASLGSPFANIAGSKQPGDPGYYAPVSQGLWHPAADYRNTPRGQEHMAMEAARANQGPNMAFLGTPEMQAAKAARQAAFLQSQSSRIDSQQADQMRNMVADWSNRVAQKYMTQAEMDAKVAALTQTIADNKAQQMARLAAPRGAGPDTTTPSTDAARPQQDFGFRGETRAEFGHRPGPGGPGGPGPGGGGPGPGGPGGPGMGTAPPNYGQINNSLLPGYGLSQNLQGFGIPGFETNPMIGGGSWAGTTWNPPAAPMPTATPNAIPNSTGTGLGPGIGIGANPGIGAAPAPGSGRVGTTMRIQMEGGGGDTGSGPDGSGSVGGNDSDVGGGDRGPGDPWGGNGEPQPSNDPGSGGGTTPPPIILPDGTVIPGFQIHPAQPYAGSPFTQQYGGKPPPYASLQDQLGAAMGGIPPAYPGFQWASPQAMHQLGGYGLPGGWTSMLGFTPGGGKP